MKCSFRDRYLNKFVLFIYDLDTFSFLRIMKEDAPNISDRNVMSFTIGGIDVWN